ncbi:hypothetical protein L0U85_14695 [Glycomyces sp. L485]|uniref:hypothetical protein n=1 Tax=Glycomyces sp. L485 TaxID=2909235 RepID=UPI001F4A8679|nr:hypothetical protein [Glycomyces sp. L485]MCH7232093.1 hypothetical protein [Glycomyces sp. L485]
MSVDLPGIPFRLERDRGLEPPSRQVADAGLRAASAGPATAVRNAAALLGTPPDADRQLGARITAAFEPLAFKAETLKELRDGS